MPALAKDRRSAAWRRVSRSADGPEKAPPRDLRRSCDESPGGTPRRSGCA